MPAKKEQPLTFQPPLGPAIRLACPLCGSTNLAVVFINVHQAGLETCVTRQAVETNENRKYPGAGYAVCVYAFCKPAGHSFTIDLQSRTAGELTIGISDPDEVCTPAEIDAAEFARYDTGYIPPEFKAVMMEERKLLFYAADQEKEPHPRACLWCKCAGTVGIKLADIRPGMVFDQIWKLDPADALTLADELRFAIETKLKFHQ